VPDIDQFPGHIACDSASQSEIVVPIFRRKVHEVDGEGKEGNREVVAIIDVDCAVKGGFDAVDQKCLEQLAGLLERCCDW
jgi:L-methionine (R)-S-oxide reductase